MKSTENYFKETNKDSVFLRAVIVAVNSLLDKSIIIKNVTDKEYEVEVPFFYNLGGDERFLQEIFDKDFYNDLVEQKYTDANIEKVPRGQFTLSSVSIDGNSLTNRFIPGYKTEYIDNKIPQKMWANLNVVPLLINFDCEVQAATKIDCFKIWECLIRKFYKTTSIDFLWQGSDIRLIVGFPEDAAVENVYEFSFGDVDMNKLTFSLECQTFIPIFDEKYNLINNMNYIENIDLSLETEKQ